MRSVTIALRVVGAATGFLILAPVPGTAFAEENAQLTDTVQALGAESGSEVRDGGQSGVVDRLQIVTLTPPSRSDADDKQGEEENAERGREGRDGKKDEGSQDGKKDREGQDGKKDRDGQGRDGREDGSDEDHGHDGDHDDGSDDDHDGDHDGEDGEDGADEDDAGAPDPAESPVAPVRAGGGGAADRLASPEAKSADTQGPGTPHTVIGLLLAGAAAVAVAFRSARRRRLGSPDRD